MLDDLKEELIVNKVGGRFKLSTLIQKRMVALNTGARPLIDARGITDKMQIVIREILEDMIFLDTAGNVQVGNATMMANIPGSYPGMKGMAAPEPGLARQATDD